MPDPRKPLVLNGAPSRLDRRLEALADDYAPVDGRSFSDLLAFAPQFGELINFYNLENQIDGDWSAFYGVDSSMALASIIAVDLPRVEATFRDHKERVIAELDPERKRDALCGLGEHLVSLARRVDGWLRCLAHNPRHESGGRTRTTLEQWVEGELAEGLRTLAAYHAGAGRRPCLGRTLDLDLKGFLPIWELNAVPPDEAIYWGQDHNEKIAHALPHFDPILEVFLAGIEQLQAFARTELPTTLDCADHRPQSALYVAFARLFEHAQASINTFSRRYIDFYYRDVLRESRRGPEPDRLYLTFTLADAEGVIRACVPAGTLFSAGKGPDGREPLYACEKSLEVTQAKLERLRTLRVVPGTEGQPTQQVLASEIRLTTEDVDADLAWSTFGPSQLELAGPQITRSEITRPATLGFALASSYLLLTGGLRQIDVTVHYELPLDPSFLVELLERTLELSLSSAGGWLKIADFKVLPSQALVVPEKTFTLQIQLPASAPAITPLDPDAAAQTPVNPAPLLPTLAVRLRQDPVTLSSDETVYPLSVLSAMRVTAFEILTTVNGLADLQLENTDGEIDASATFLPFGGTPAVGSYLRIYHRELFVKSLSDLQIGIQWFDLPQNHDGFFGYYKDYRIGLDGQRSPTPLFNNASFQGDFRILEPGLWTLDPAESPAYLFRTTEDCSAARPTTRGSLCPATGFDGLAPVRPISSALPDWYRPEDSAIELTLSDPPYAFGNDLYTQNVLYSVLKDLKEFDSHAIFRASQAHSEHLPDAFPVPPDPSIAYPNTPWLPQAETLLVDYTAGCRLNLHPANPDATLEQADGQCFHLLPFNGIAELSAESGDGAAYLFPQIDPMGQLLLGFEGLHNPQTLSLLVEMQPLVIAGDTPGVDWSILNRGRWQKLPPSAKKLDTTGDLTSTGLLSFALPALADSGPVTEPSDLQWLRASVSRDADHFPKTLSITPHAVTAVAVLARDGASSGPPSATDPANIQTQQPLPAHSIQGSVQDLPDIGSIDQPLQSFGGRPAETANTFDIRVGERLRHKDRAILCWDAERLVLERFPTVWKTQTLPARNPQGKPAPGHTTVMVVPGPNARQNMNPTTPTASSDLLADITDYLKRRASPFVTFHVINPPYLRIQVRAQVSFRPDSTEGSNIDRLNEELVEYLSPWFYDASRATLDGDYVTEPAVADFIQSRPYVEWVDDVLLTPALETVDLEWCFLTSAEKHVILDSSTLDWPPDGPGDPGDPGDCHCPGDPGCPEHSVETLPAPRQPRRGFHHE